MVCYVLGLGLVHCTDFNAAWSRYAHYQVPSSANVIQITGR